MGSFAVSYHVKAKDARRIANAARAALSDQGLAPADQRPDSDFDWAGSGETRAIRLTEPHDGWVGLLDTAVGEDCDLARILSRELKTDAIHVMVNDSDSWHYRLFHNGEETDAFDSMDLDEVGASGWRNGSDDDDDADGGAAIPDMNATMEAQRRNLQALHARFDEQMPPEIREIKERMAVNAVSMEETRLYMGWFQQHGTRLIQELMRGGGLPMVNPLMAGGAGGTGTAAPDNVRLREHLRRLRPFLHDGVGDDLVLSVLGQQTVFAEETLARFLPLLGISEMFANLNYRYRDEMEDGELAVEGISFVDHLKFARA